VSPETLLEPTLVDPTPNLNPNQPFDPDSFNSYVMNTYGRFPIAIAKGLGCLLWDTSGKQYLDFVAGIATCTLGHAHPALIEVVSQQIQKLHHVSNLYYIPEQGELAKWIVDHSCADKYAHTVLDFLEQPVILTAHASFHGRTLATITATGQPKYQKDFEPLMPGFAYIPYNDIEAVENAIADLDEGNRRVAAIMLEPLQGEGGVRPGAIEYFQRLRQICDENNILLVFDEVQVGVGRTGKLWGYENLGVEPDIFTSAKGLAGGIPIGAMMCRKFCDVFEPGSHASTFGGNPFACASALTVLQTIERDHLLENVQQRGEQLRARLRVIASQYPHLFVDVRGWGLINGLEINSESELVSSTIVNAIVSETEVDEAMDKLEAAIAKVF